MSFPLGAETPRIKICGVTREEDVLAAVQHGASYLGLNFYERSPRFLELDRARALRAAVPDGVRVVGVFVNAAPEVVRRTQYEVGLDLVQFHGDEPLEEMRPFAAQAIRAVRHRTGMDAADLQIYDDFFGVLVDAPSSAASDGAYGGTGESWAWEQVRPLSEGRRLFLAGGLRPENVAMAIRSVPGAYAVDVSSGIESAPGVKSRERLASFQDQVLRSRGAEASETSRLEVQP